MAETEPAGLSDARLAAIEARCAAAAPGPWVAWAGQGWSKAWAEHWGLDPGVGTVWPIAPEGVTGPNGHPEPDQWLLTTTEPAVQTFVAHARADVPALAAEVRRLQRQRDTYYAALTWAVAEGGWRLTYYENSGPCPAVVDTSDTFNPRVRAPQELDTDP